MKGGEVIIRVEDKAEIDRLKKLYSGYLEDKIKFIDKPILAYYKMPFATKQSPSSAVSITSEDKNNHKVSNSYNY